MPFCSPDKIIVPEGRFRTPTKNDVVEMADSIKQVGQLQPILVTKNMELVEGLTRLRACEWLKREVFYVDEVDAKLVFENPLQVKKAELQANLKRTDFTPVQLSCAYAELHKLMTAMYGQRKPGQHTEGWTQSQTAKMLGVKSPTTISDALQIAEAEASGLYPELQRAKTTTEAKKIIKRANGSPMSQTPNSQQKFLDIDKEVYLFHQGKRYKLQSFNNEHDFEEFICKNIKLFFGQNNQYIDAKHKIKTKLLGATPDGLFLDISDENKPILYLVEIEISTHQPNHYLPHIINYAHLIKTSKQILRENASGYIDKEMQAILNKCKQQDNFGILFIVDKEDTIIELLFGNKPHEINNYKIISIQSYINMQSRDMIFAKIEYLSPDQYNKNKNGKPAELTVPLTPEDLADFD
ncbi:MAG: ParB/RepB/Spo0J family partition protein [Desulfobaccales bacterium]